MVIVSGFSYIYRSSRAIEAERQARLGEPSRMPRSISTAIGGGE